MKKHTIISAMVLFSGSTIAQINLVPNADFEIFDTCPDFYNQVPYAKGWLNFGLSPEYFNSCSTNPDISVPYNISGSYQNAASGNAYIGLYTSFIAPNLPLNVREYVGIKLTKNLNPGSIYYASFKVCQGQDNPNLFNCSSNNIGFRFSTIDYEIYGSDSSTNFYLTKNIAQVNYQNVITDTSNWLTVGNAFRADSAYKYLIIGNFFDDSRTSIIHHKTLDFCLAYYYIDDVNVFETIDSFPVLNEDCFELIQNLTNDNITIRSINNSTASYFKLSIYNLIGKLIYKDNYILQGSTKNISISFLSSGLYFIKVESVCNSKIIKIVLNK